MGTRHPSTTSGPRPADRLRTAARRLRPDRLTSAVRTHQRYGPPPVAPWPVVELPPRDAVRENGFAVFRGLVAPDECASLAAQFKADAGIVEGEHYTRTDATNKIPSTRRVLFDGRVLDAVRATLGGEARFLQVSDLHYLHDTAGWHRDSVHRAEDNSDAADWRSDDGAYGVVKAILYLESANAAMGLVPGSHLSHRRIDVEQTKDIERHGGQVIVDGTDEPNRRFSARERERPLSWRARPGDLLVFDQRTYHAGRRVDDGRASSDRDAAKFTLSLVFGSDNVHSYRFYSYFRYARRELGYRPYPADYLRRLDESGLLLRTGTANYYREHPDELRLAHLRRPETLEALIAEFRAG